MTKVAFYILEHPQVNPTNCEFKENDDTDNYSHLQEVKYLLLYFLISFLIFLIFFILKKKLLCEIE